MLEYAGALTLYHTFDKILNLVTTPKLSRNCISLTHATGAIMLTLSADSFNMDILKLWSTGYFASDILYMLSHDRVTLQSMAYMYHHLASIYIIHKPINWYYGDVMIFWGEMSNIPTYLVYYYLHQAPTLRQRQQLLLWKQIQKIMYSIIRIPIVTMIAMKLWKRAPSKVPLAIISPIYIMGIIWTLKILRNK